MAAALNLVERVITQNIYQRNISAYRGLPELDSLGRPVPVAENAGEAQLNRLWTFSSMKCKGYTVTCIAWNRVNPDICAISYGYNVKSKRGGGDERTKGAGIVACWNIKNLEHPERIFELPSSDGATSCDFSKRNPNLLAVGLFNGNVAVFNVTRKASTPLTDSMDSTAKHLGPVWSVKWVERERGTEDREEVLISISHDGRVVQWTIRKGFEALVLLKVKRTENRAKKVGHGKKIDAGSRKTESATISQFAPTTAFDFHPSDGNSYLVGTEEGTIHRCSCSYNEQTLDSYTGHTGRIYAVRWHPTMEKLFISCSEDWTMRIWHQKQTSSLITLISGQRPIRHIAWSPFTPSIFVAITDDSVDVWDVPQSQLDPAVSMPLRSGSELSVLSFSPISDCVVVGDSDGVSNVYQVRGFARANAAVSMAQVVEASFNSQ